MDLMQLIIVLVAIGVIMWVINTYVPMDAKIKQILNIVVPLVVVLWLLFLFVDIPRIRVGRP